VTSARRERPRAETDVGALRRQILELRTAVHAHQRALLKGWQPFLRDRTYRESAANIAAYIGLRQNDIRPIQRFLASLGLTSLSNCEGHVTATLDAVEHVLGGIAGEGADPERLASIAREMGRKLVLLRRNTNQLFGASPASRWTRFMVTFPTEAARDYELVRELVARGMDVARINCAHDGPREWARMAGNVRRAERETGRPCRILMDLSGPKLRVGPVQTGKAEIRLKVKRDAHGKVLRACHVVLDAGPRPNGNGAGEVHIGVDREWLDRLRPKDRVRFTDLRGRDRAFVVEKRLTASAVLARIDRGSYLDESTTLEHFTGATGQTIPAVPQAIGPVRPAPVEIRVAPGEVLLLTREPLPGGPRKMKRGKVIAPAHIACSEGRIFDALRVGHRVWIDDGRIGTVVEALDEHGAWLRVQRAREKGERIAPGKGMNFPDSELPLPPLSDTDRADLDFAVKHADIVGFSFVREPGDIDQLVDALAARGRTDMGIVAKIETRAALRHLPEIIVHGAGRQPFGIMIARGDLAVEIGYERLAEAQEEILSLCEAAHVPVIWATQVLENLVKTGRPSRAEITDAAMAERAECVMLNKGPYLLQALAVLDSVVQRMQVVLRKKTAQFAPRRWS